VPAILRSGPYRFFFYAGDRSEPVHIHVERDDNVAKFWVRPCKLENSGGFGRSELARIYSIVKDHEDRIWEAWYEYFGS